jgi:uncharacterized delta-60 repeat protein
MPFIPWLSDLLSPRGAARPRRNRAGFRPRVEVLEARDNPSTGGLLDPTFGSGGLVTTSFPSSPALQSVLVQPDGKVVAAGWAYTARTSDDFVVVRYNADGSLDTGFGSGGIVTTDINKGSDDVAEAMVLQPGTNGKILVAGSTSNPVKGRYFDDYNFALVRYNANGTLDTTFGTNGKVTTDLGSAGDVAYAMAVQPDGKIILAGRNGANELALVRYTANGALDPTFGTGGKLVTGISITGGPGGSRNQVSISLEPDGRIVVAGTSIPSATVWDFLVARFNSNGTPDTSFGGGAGLVTTDFGREAGPTGLAIQPDGRIVVCGISQIASVGNQDIALARYNTDGSLDASFGAGGTLIAPLPQPAGSTQYRVGEAFAVALQADGRIVVGGYESGTTAIAERFNADGSVDTGYGTAGTGVSEVPFSGGDPVFAMAIQPDGKMVFAGQSNASFVLFRLLGSAPQVSPLTATPNPASAGAAVSLAVAASGGNPGALGAVTQVALYADSNADGQLETGSDLFRGYASYDAASGQWKLTISTTGWAPGSYTLFAQAKDGYGAFSDAFALPFTLL